MIWLLHAHLRIIPLVFCVFAQIAYLCFSWIIIQSSINFAPQTNTLKFVWIVRLPDTRIEKGADWLSVISFPSSFSEKSCLSKVCFRRFRSMLLSDGGCCNECWWCCCCIECCCCAGVVRLIVDDRSLCDGDEKAEERRCFHLGNWEPSALSWRLLWLASLAGVPMLLNLR